MKKIFITCLFLGSIALQAQYTETINSNRPGNSQGAFAVGYNVIQLETGVRYGHNEHALRNTETSLFGVDYSLRYGLGFERFEVNLTGSYLASNQKMWVGASEEEIKYRNFESNTLGLKYLVFDPYKYRSLEKPNIRSWKANFKFRWRDLIPAVSVYAGANLLFGDNPYMFPEEPSVSPKVALITQHNYRRWVLVMNFIGDKISTDFPTYAGIFTLTHSLSQNVAIFGEYQAIKSDLYSDDIARIGAAYLINKDFQVDASALLNFKDTPSRWQVALGVSYRVDMFHIDAPVIPKSEKNKKGTGGKEAEKAKQEKIEELKKQGL